MKRPSLHTRTFEINKKETVVQNVSDRISRDRSKGSRPKLVKVCL